MCNERLVRSALPHVRQEQEKYMADIDAPARDATEIVDRKASLLGRLLVVGEKGLKYQGPITDISATDGQLIITLKWRAFNCNGAGTNPSWRVADDEPYPYSADLDRTVVHFAEDGTVDITVLEGAPDRLRVRWVGKILPHNNASSPRLAN